MHNPVCFTGESAILRATAVILTCLPSSEIRRYILRLVFMQLQFIHHVLLLHHTWQSTRLRSGERGGQFSVPLRPNHWPENCSFRYGVVFQLSLREATICWWSICKQVRRGTFSKRPGSSFC
jgi:hypothetical protein